MPSPRVGLDALAMAGVRDNATWNWRVARASGFTARLIASGHSTPERPALVHGQDAIGVEFRAVDGGFKMSDVHGEML